MEEHSMKEAQCSTLVFTSFVSGCQHDQTTQKDRKRNWSLYKHDVLALKNFLDPEEFDCSFL